MFVHGRIEKLKHRRAVGNGKERLGVDIGFAKVRFKGGDAVVFPFRADRKGLEEADDIIDGENVELFGRERRAKAAQEVH